MLSWVTESLSAKARGLHLFKTQQKHMISCAIHPDTTVMNREAILSTAAKLRFFPAWAPNREHSFFLFCIDTAVPKAHAETCYARIWFKVLSKSTAKIPLFSKGGRLRSQRTHSSASLISTFSPQDLHGFPQHPFSSSPSLFSAHCRNRKVSMHVCNQTGCILHLDANLGALQNFMLTQTHMKN